MTAPDPTGFRAVWSWLDDPLPEAGVLAVAGADGSLFAADHLLLAGIGVAAVLPLTGGLVAPDGRAAAQRWLSAVPVDADGHPGGVPDEDGHTGTGTGSSPAGRVVAVGALPFDRTAPGALVVPALTVGRDDNGRWWATLVGPAGRTTVDTLRVEVAALTDRARAAAGAQADEPAPGAGGGAPPTLVEVPPGAGYAAAVGQAVAHIGAGELDKVVLARSVEVGLPDQPELGRVVRRLRVQEPSCTTFAVAANPGGRSEMARFVGASPELLVRRRGRAVACHPLAGTIGLTGDADADAATVERFLGSAKEHREHRLVVDDIATVLRPLTDDLRVPDQPSLVRLQSVAHFGTLIDGTLHPGRAAGSAVPSVLDLVAALHPTPAVGGVPTDRALLAIAALEVAPRGLWAGPVGWVDGAGDGEWMIGLRSATVAGRAVHLHAGAGVVSGSDPDAELAETTVKLTPILDAVVPGGSSLL